MAYYAIPTGYTNMIVRDVNYGPSITDMLEEMLKTPHVVAYYANVGVSIWIPPKGTFFPYFKRERLPSDCTWIVPGTGE